MRGANSYRAPGVRVFWNAKPSGFAKGRVDGAGGRRRPVAERDAGGFGVPGWAFPLRCGCPTGMNGGLQSLGYFEKRPDGAI